MGWASYLEEVRTKVAQISDDCARLGDSSRVNDLRAKLGLLNVDLDRHLEIATNPSMDLAHEVVVLKEALRLEKVCGAELDQELSASRKERQDLHGRLQVCQRDLEQKNMSLSQTRLDDPKYTRLLKGEAQKKQRRSSR